MKTMIVATAMATLMTTAPAAAATLVAGYGFDGTLNANTAGGASLAAIDPTGANGFSTDTVFGQARTVYIFRGGAQSALNGGLSYSGGGLTANSYSVAMTFKFDGGNNNWRRILDVNDRANDSGFYVNTGNNLAVYPDAGSNVNFVSGVYRNVVLTVSGNTVSGYIDGGSSFSAQTDVMRLNGSPLTFFADNLAGGGQNEWSSGSIAALRLYDGVLTAEQIRALNDVPFVEPPVQPGAVPEPATWAMMIAGFGLVGGAARRRTGPRAVVA